MNHPTLSFSLVSFGLITALASPLARAQVTSWDNSPYNYNNSPLNYNNSPLNYNNSPPIMGCMTTKASGLVMKSPPQLA
jgi:hypothetical protein